MRVRCRVRGRGVKYGAFFLLSFAISLVLRCLSCCAGGVIGGFLHSFFDHTKILLKPNPGVSSYACNVPCQISPMYPLQRLPPQHHRHRRACTLPPIPITTTVRNEMEGKGGAPVLLQPSPTARARRPHRPQSPRQPPAPNECTCVRPPSTPLPLRV
jgi:hypothetical protein